MKFLAILKDSFREAIDAKILYVMIGLSLLVILFLGSISYRPVPVEEEVRQKMAQLTNRARQRAMEVARLQGSSVDVEPPRIDVRSFRQTDGAADKPWTGRYEFQLVFVFDKASDLALLREHDKQLPPDRQLNPEQIGSLVTGAVRVLDPRQTRAVETPAASDRELVFTVTTAPRPMDVESWPHQPALFFGLLPLPSPFWWPRSAQVDFIMSGIVNRMGAGIAMLVSTIITAFFIPNMLRKGTIDLLLVKPVHRSTLLLYKYVGGLTFMFLNTVVIVVGIWFVIGLRSGLWVNGFLLSVLVLTFEFAIYYAFSTVCAVLTRGPIVAILLTSVLWLVIFAVGGLYQQVEMQRKFGNPEDSWPSWLVSGIDTAHYVLPRIRDLDMLNEKLVLDSLRSEEHTSEL